MEFEQHRYLIINALRKLKKGDYEKINSFIVNDLIMELEKIYKKSGREKILDKIIKKALKKKA